jgi:hypothetical protein
MKFVFVAVLLIIFVFALVLAAPPQHPMSPNRAQHSNRLHPHECVREALKIKDSAGRREALERCKTEMRRRQPHLGPRHPVD